MGKFIDRICTYKNRYKLTNNSDGTITLDRVWGTVTQAGTPLTASALNAACPPVGSVIPYAGASAPAGWLLCQGQSVSRTTYSELFAAIGTTYGSGDGSATFNLPNLKGRIPVGYDSTQTEFNYRGKTGGEKAHALTKEETPPLGANQVEQASTYGKYVYDTYLGWNGEAHNNLQPYVAMNYIIRY